QEVRHTMDKFRSEIMAQSPYQNLPRVSKRAGARPGGGYFFELPWDLPCGRGRAGGSSDFLWAAGDFAALGGAASAGSGGSASSGRCSRRPASPPRRPIADMCARFLLTERPPF